MPYVGGVPYERNCLSFGTGLKQEERGRKHYVKLDNSFVGDRDYRGSSGVWRPCRHSSGPGEDSILRIFGVVRIVAALRTPKRLDTGRRDRNDLRVTAVFVL